MAEAPSPGHRPGLLMDASLSPCKDKSFPPSKKNTPLIYNVESGKNDLKPPHLVKYY